MIRTADHKYGLLLIALVCFIMLSPLTTNSYIGRVCFLALFVFTIVGVSKSVAAVSYYRWVLPLVGLLSVLVNLFVAGQYQFVLIARLLSLVFFGLTIWQFSLDIFQDCKASIDSLFGSVCIYLLIGTVFATIYQVVQLLIPGSFVYSTNNFPVGQVFDYYYFSFIALTTTGFGDIVPMHQLAKAFVTIESVTGLFYLAILVAHLATLMNATNKQR